MGDSVRWNLLSFLPSLYAQDQNSMGQPKNIYIKKTVPNDPKLIEDNPIVQEICLRTDSPNPFIKEHPEKSFSQLLRDRELNGGLNKAQNARINNQFLPSKHLFSIEHHDRVFCGNFSKDGEVFMSAAQDGYIRLFDSEFSLKRQIHAKDVGWSVLDTDYSPDQRFLIYSSWSPYVHLCNITENNFETHLALDFQPHNHRAHNFCLFSIKFSSNSSEILGGSNSGFLYIYDMASENRVLEVQGHDEDVNTVSFLDDQPNLFLSGSDDCTCKVWDRRAIGDRKPVGVMVGHLGGITHIDSKEDGRFFISNSKDMSIKLWDMRKMCTPNAKAARIRTDYRYAKHPYPGGKYMIEDDCSLVTYSGHTVSSTLVRAKISPLHNTGQKYIYSGSSDGGVYFWNILTGELVQHFFEHEDIVRDVSWHPYDQMLVSASWDRTIQIWTA